MSWTLLISYTSGLGFVACCVTSKRLGIGSAEWSWADVKQIKDWKQSNLGGTRLKKRAILFTSAKLERQIPSEMLPIPTIPIFGDDNMK